MPKLISISSLLSKSWSLYRSRFSYFVSLLAVPYGIFVLNSLVAQFIFSTPLVLVLSLVSLILLVLATIAILLSLESNELPDFKQSWQLAWPHFWPLVLVSLVTGFVVVGGMFLFFVPGLIFAFYLTFVKAIVVLENKKGLSALSRSWSYVRGYFWAITGRMLLLMLISAIVSTLVSLVTSMLGEFIGNLISLSLQIFLVPFMLTYSYCLYKDVREIKGTEVNDSDSRRSVVLAGWFGLAGWLVLVVSIILFFLVIGSPLGDLVTNIILNNSLAI